MAKGDDDRLIEEIENYLKTGRGPRPVPEPRRRPKRPPRRRTRRVVRGVWSHPLLRGGVVLAVLATVLVLVHHHAASQATGVDHASTAAAGPDYSFLRTNPSGSPMRWNPCAPIHYRTNLVEAPPSAAADLAQAVQQVSGATGIRFVDDGSTTTIPNKNYEQRATTHRSPVVITWASSSETDLLGQTSLVAGVGFVHELGVGGPGALIDRATGHGAYVSGIVVIDSQASARLSPGFGPGSLGVVLMHELGHLVGLGHSSNTGDIMNPVVQATKDGTWGTGDLAGLARLGIASRCLKPPERTTTIVL